MKLKDKLRILEDNRNGLEMKISTSAQGQTHYTNFSGLVNFNKAIKEINKTGLIRNIFETYQRSPLFNSQQNDVQLIQSEAKLWADLVGQLSVLADSLIESLAEDIETPLPDSISIKLPNDIKDFDDLSKVSSEIQKVLSLSIIDEEIGGEILIKGVDSGSIWIDVLLGTAAAMEVIAAVTWSAMVIYKKTRENSITNEQVASLQIKTEVMKELQTAQADLIKKMLAAEANHIDNTFHSEADIERINRLNLSIKTLTELIMRGAEIQPSITADEGIKLQFPLLDKIAMIESKIKQIGAGS